MNKTTTLLFSGITAFASSAFAADDQPYIYDYYDNDTPASEYVKNYQGNSFNGPHTVSAIKPKIEGEDFDNGGEGISWHFQYHKSNDYRTDLTGVAINNFGDGHVIGNVSPGDWLCYTIQVEDEGEYRMTIHCSSDIQKDFYYEVDGKAAGSILSTPGKGWDNYSDVINEGIQLSKGKHIIRWLPSNAMNVDYFTLEHTGDYTGSAEGGISFQYPRHSSYTSNPLFTDLTSPMWGCGFTSPLYTADPSAHVWNIDGKDVLYLYASHDMTPAVGCDHMDQYHIFSTEDLINWTDHGEVMNAITSNTYTGTQGDGCMWAPDCAYNPHDGLYYFIYPHKLTDDKWYQFLATSENPAGPWKCLGYIKGVPSTIDPCIFVDDDGTAYLFAGGIGQDCVVGKLKRDNWLELDGDMTVIKGTDGTFAGAVDEFHEAPWMFKRNGIYYLCHSDGNPNNNRLRYSTAPTPTGPFTPQGIYMHPHGNDTAHGSVVEFNGKWYSFYHTADFSGNGVLRSVCFDELTFAEDGKINMVNTWGEAYGGNPVELSLSTSTTISAGSYNNGGNARGFYKRNGIAPEREGTVSLDNFEWLRFDVDVKDAGKYSVTVKATASDDNCRIMVNMNGERKTGENGISFPTDRSSLTIYPVNLEAGKQYLELRAREGTIEIESVTLEAGFLSVPGTIQAEDLDADDYIFQDVNGAKNNNRYRDDVDVAMETNSEGYHIGFTSSGDHYCYTFRCMEEGYYDIISYIALGSGGSSRYQLLMDGIRIEDHTFSGNDWGKWNQFKTSDIFLSEGIHKMQFNVATGPMNVDKFTFNLVTATGGAATISEDNPSTVDVYSIDGRLLRKDIERSRALEGLENGMYIVGNKKILKVN